jgi:hypothetical protein
MILREMNKERNRKPFRPVTLLLVVVLSGFPLQAQWKIGAALDFNIAGIRVSPVPGSESYSNYLGLGLGAVVDREITSRIHVHTEPMFLQKGARLEDPFGSLLFKILYMEIPLMARYEFVIDAPVRPYALIGPSVGFLLNAKYVFEGGGEQNETEYTRALDFGAGFGGGVKLPLDEMDLFAETRYMFGFVNVNKEAGESVVNNRGLQIILGAAFPIGD